MAVYKSKKPTKDGRAYFFRIKYKDIFGEVHDYTSPKFLTNKEAKLEESKYRIKIEEQKTCTTSITIGQAYLEYIEDKKKKVKKQTLIKEGYRHKYYEMLDKYKVNDLTVPIYKKWRLEFDKINITSITKNKIIQQLKRVISYSNKYYNTSDSILKFIEPFKDANEFEKEMDFFTLEEYKKFDSVIDNFEYHVVFEMLYYLGLRQGELQALTWEDIDLDKKIVHIRKTLTTKIKGEKYTISTPKTKNSKRDLPLTKNILEDLKTLKNKAKEYRNYEEKWFVFGNVYPFGETRIQKAKNKYCDLAELKRIRVHDFRHSCASLLINQKATIALVSKYLGHANVSITLNIYTHMYKSELDYMVELIEKIN